MRASVGAGRGSPALSNTHRARGDIGGEGFRHTARRQRARCPAFADGAGTPRRSAGTKTVCERQTAHQRSRAAGKRSRRRSSDFDGTPACGERGVERARGCGRASFHATRGGYAVEARGCGRAGFHAACGGCGVEARTGSLASFHGARSGVAGEGRARFATTFGTACRSFAGESRAGSGRTLSTVIGAPGHRSWTSFHDRETRRAQAHRATQSPCRIGAR